MTTANELARLERIDDLQSVWENEAWDFTPWLARPENLTVLSDALGIELETAGQEVRVGPFRADIVCKDTSDDSWVLIENQMERTDHTHLGQLLTYAAGLQTVTIVWVAKRFTQQHRAALDWLNEITDEQFRFFGAEIELYRIGKSPYALRFNIVSRPNDWSSSTQRAVSTDSVSGTLHLCFWTQFREHLDENYGHIKQKAPAAKPYMDYPVGKGGFSIPVYRSTSDKQVWVGLRIAGPDHIAYFDLLRQMRDAIEREIGYRLDWQGEIQNASRVIRPPLTADPSDESDWPNQVEWAAKTLADFDRVFRPRVKELNAADWQPGDEPSVD